MKNRPVQSNTKTASPEELANMKPERNFDAFQRLVEILRMECPWDRKQTHDSIKENLLEEAYEVVNAIDKGDMTELKYELGDLFLHVLFQSLLASESGSFTVSDVIESAMEKLIRRHPHVFSEMSLDSGSAVARNWEAIKMTEGRNSVLDGIPENLPSLIRSYRIQEKAANLGFDWPETAGALESAREEFEEWSDALEEESVEHQTEELGDLLFSIVNVSRKMGLSPEEAMRGTNRKFSRRFQYVETRLKDQNRSVEKATLEEMDLLWNEAKSKGL